MARKERFVRTGKTDAMTGAELVEITVKVGEKHFTTTRPLFTTVDQLGGLTDDECLNLCNYAEDVFARAECTREHTPAGGKTRERNAAREHWRSADKATFIKFFVDESHDQKEIDAALDAYYAEN